MPSEERQRRGLEISRTATPALLSALLVTVAGLSCRDHAPAAASSNLLLVTVDTLRADHLSSYGYFRPTSPAIDRLAQQGLVFDHAYAPMATTLPSHTSLLTSSEPARHGVLSNFRFFKHPVPAGGELRTAAQILSEAGYATAAFTSSSPLSEATGIGAGFKVFRGPPAYESADRRIELRAKATVDRALAWLEGAPPPWFLWVHLFDPHTPYRPPGEFGTRFGDEPGLRRLLTERGIAGRAAGKASQAINRYDGEILYVDAQIARVLDRLSRRGLEERSVVVFAADHGEGLYQHGVAEHGVTWEEQIRVPLILRIPGRPGRRVADLASLIDVLPILAEETDLPLDSASFDGVNVLRRPRSGVLSQRAVRRQGPWSSESFAWTTRRWKYVYFADGRDRLYDLEGDPGETRNLIHRHRERARDMKAELLRRVADAKARSALRIQEEVSDSARDQLEALGYVE